jgi:hypothetical protein
MGAVINEFAEGDRVPWEGGVPLGGDRDDVPDLVAELKVGR